MELRRTLLLPLDDLLAVVREFLCADVSRSGLDRCLRRHGVGSLAALKPAEVQTRRTRPSKPTSLATCTWTHQVPAADGRRDSAALSVRGHRPGHALGASWLHQKQQDGGQRQELSGCAAQGLSDQVSPGCSPTTAKSSPTGCSPRLSASPAGSMSSTCCARELGIEHRLTKPKTPQTNGMVERFNGRISGCAQHAPLPIRSQDLEQTLLRYVALYNHQLPQSALKSKTPIQTMKDWYATHPHLLIKRPYDRPGCDS